VNIFSIALLKKIEKIMEEMFEILLQDSATRPRGWSEMICNISTHMFCGRKVFEKIIVGGKK
jgi:hypothetical protein